MPKLNHISATLEALAPLSLQEPYDNTGWQLLPQGPEAECTGVLLCVDLTPEILHEAGLRGCNMIVTHHPLLFRAVKQLTPAVQTSELAIEAIRRGISVYSCHTAIDSAPGGISAVLAQALGLADVRVLDPNPTMPGAGMGAIGILPQPLSAPDFAALVKKAYGSPIVRCTVPRPQARIHTVALCGGAGADLIPRAIALGADAYVTSDTKHNCFVDYANRLFLVDTGHYEAEKVAVDIFYRIISKKFP